jgi:hypothetical protein
MPFKTTFRSKLSTPRLMWGFLLLFIFAVLSIGVFSQTGLADSYKLATSHLQEKYTQLYFNNPAKLPIYSPAGKTEKIVFTIANYEAKTETYTYQTDLSVNGSVSSITNRVTLKNGQSTILIATMMIPKPNTPATLNIRLVGLTNQLTLKSTS